MNREAINYVKDAEAKVEELRAKADEEIKKIAEHKKTEIQKLKSQTEKELEAFRNERHKETVEALQKDKEVFDRNVSEETERFNQAYEDKKESLANRIAEEVLRRYGNS